MRDGAWPGTTDPLWADPEYLRFLVGMRLHGPVQALSAAFAERFLRISVSVDVAVAAFSRAFAAMAKMAPAADELSAAMRRAMEGQPCE